MIGSGYGGSAVGGTTYYSVLNLTNCYGAKDCINGYTNRKVLQHDYKATVKPVNCAELSMTELKTSSIYNNANIKLDYDYWIARENESPIPRVFIDWIIDEDDTVEKPGN